MKLFLSGDVMTGRGVDQILRSPCDPAIDEPWMKSALDYVLLAERSSGTIPRGVAPEYIWGDALAELERERPDARIVNLETAVTRSDARAAKGINYRMSPENAACLAAAKIDCCVLANNHVLDWGRPGLVETLDTLHALGMRTAGAGLDAASAAVPARLAGNLLVFAYGLDSAGVPEDWAAGPASPGVSWLPDLSRQTADALVDRILPLKRPGEISVVSVHWGPNWGYQVSHRQRSFARRLIDAGAADLVHGHSSHHPLAIERYRERLILYGCGDLLNDYEGISGHEEFRPQLGLMYFPTLAADGKLAALSLTPVCVHCFRLERASEEDAAWLAMVLARESGLPIERTAEGLRLA
ncbi:MAG TPA: CapA family protein [Burkholderiales bacterium]|nr:CapA family protein [Burkholderiales bacterium]